MNAAKFSENEYIQFLIATQKAYSCTEAERVHPNQGERVAHDAINRLLHRLEPSSDQLWAEAQTLVTLKQGILVVDDSTLDKWYARKIALITRHWSGKHARVVQGINLITLLWTDGDGHIPIDYRFYEKLVDGATKNHHFQQMVLTAQHRAFQPQCVVFDSWYSSLANLKLLRDIGWRWLTRLKKNRLVNPDGVSNRPLETVELSEGGTRVHLKGYGFIQVFKIVSPNKVAVRELASRTSATVGDIDYWATNDLEMNPLKRLQ